MGGSSNPKIGSSFTVRKNQKFSKIKKFGKNSSFISVVSSFISVVNEENFRKYIKNFLRNISEKKNCRKNFSL